MMTVCMDTLHSGQAGF